MDALVKKCEYLHGKVKVPGSKSYTHRVIAAASLYGSSTFIENPSNSEANAAIIGVCRKLGADISWDENKNIHVKGFKGHPTVDGIISVGNSGTALRIAVALASLANGKITIDGDSSLRNRPTKPLIDALNGLGADIAGELRSNSDGDVEEYAPVKINGKGLDGGSISVLGEQSSQYLSSLLLVSNFAKSDVNIEVIGKMVSAPYIVMTLEVLENFGIKIDFTHDFRHFHVQAQQPYVKPSSYSIPGDYSQAAFFLAAACLVKSDVTVKGLVSTDKQGDKIIVEILRKMGAKIEEEGNDLRVRGPFELKGGEFDLIDTPDLFPVLSVLGVYAKGKTRLYNMPQIRSKETDRIAVIEREFIKHGIKVESKWDEMTVYQIDLPDKEYVFSADGGKGVTDHRVAMAFSLIGIRSGCAVIKEANSVRISYPDYFDHLQQVGVETEIVSDEQTEKIVV